MSRFSYVMAFATMMLLVAGQLFSQSGGGVITSAGSVSSRSNSKEITFNYNYPPGALIYFVAGVPYSGHMSSENLRTLANGIHLKNSPPIDQPMTYRDAAGRTRTDATMSPVPRSAPAAANIKPHFMRLPEITDPIAGFRYVIDDENRIAHRIAIQGHANPVRPSGLSTAAPRVPQRAQANEVTLTSEDLGTQSMFGITVTGRRTTRTYPPGTYQDNDGPLTAVSETWRSEPYGLVLLGKESQPDGTESSSTMKDFSTAEPDPALFLVPSGYQIVDETGEFTITLTAGPK